VGKGGGAKSGQGEGKGGKRTLTKKGHTRSMMLKSLLYGRRREKSIIKKRVGVAHVRKRGKWTHQTKKSRIKE